MLTESTYGFSRPRPLFQSESVSTYLDGVLASTVCDLDATIAASYGGSGTTWANLVTAPADGSAQTAYDFYLGNGSTGTTYPAFNASSGSAAAYWSVDGGDYFSLKSGANTSFLNSLHKTTGGSDWWIAMALKYVTNSTGQYFSTARTGTAGQTGIQADQNAGAFRIAQRGNAAAILCQAGHSFTLFLSATNTLIMQKRQRLSHI